MALENMLQKKIMDFHLNLATTDEAHNAGVDLSKTFRTVSCMSSINSPTLYSTKHYLATAVADHHPFYMFPSIFYRYSAVELLKRASIMTLKDMPSDGIVAEHIWKTTTATAG